MTIFQQSNGEHNMQIRRPFRISVRLLLMLQHQNAVLNCGNQARFEKQACDLIYVV